MSLWTRMFDHIASRDDWNLASFSLSLNMTSDFSVDEFRQRIRYGINKVAQTHPTKPISCITLYTYYNDIFPKPNDKSYEKEYKLRAKVISTW